MVTPSPRLSCRTLIQASTAAATETPAKQLVLVLMP
jgi:hypothetical protein